jgi:cytochrome c oxidase cbb3-type subunit 3
MSSVSRRAALCAGLLLVGCQRNGHELASTGSPAATEAPVGPIPGPGVVVAEKNPLQDDDDARHEGQVLFARYNCAGCHGDHGGGGMGPSLRDNRWLYGKADFQIFNSIAQGRGHGMPAWGVKLPKEQIWKLVEYIKSMRTPEEPMPPPAAPDRFPTTAEVAR